MDLDSELAFFYQLAKNGNLTATARELNLTPPPSQNASRCWKRGWACAC
jgi:DNA-binding transcriptional LysR family regulator